MNHVPVLPQVDELPNVTPAKSWLRRLRLVAFYLGCALLLAGCLLPWMTFHVSCPLSPEQQRIQIQAAADMAQARRWVWVNTNSGTYHEPGTRWYGKTSSGKYLPEWLARVEGDRVAGNGQ